MNHWSLIDTFHKDVILTTSGQFQEEGYMPSDYLEAVYLHKPQNHIITAIVASLGGSKSFDNLTIEWSEESERRYHCHVDKMIVPDVPSAQPSSPEGVYGNFWTYDVNDLGNATTTLTRNGTVIGLTANDNVYLDHYRPGMTVALMCSNNIAEIAIGRVRQILPKGSSAALPDKTVLVVMLPEGISFEFIKHISEFTLAGGEVSEYSDRLTGASSRPRLFRNTIGILRQDNQQSHTALKLNPRYVRNGDDALLQDVSTKLADMVENYWIFSKHYIGEDPLTGNPIRKPAGLLQGVFNMDGHFPTGGHIIDMRAHLPTNGTFVDHGLDAFDNIATELFDRIPQNAHLLCGPGVIAGFSKLARKTGDMEVTTDTTKIGLRISTVRTSQGTFEAVAHPEFAKTRALNHAMFGIDFTQMQMLNYREMSSFITDDLKVSGKDGICATAITEMGFQMQGISSSVVLLNVGLDKNQTVIQSVNQNTLLTANEGELDVSPTIVENVFNTALEGVPTVKSEPKEVLT